MSTQAAIIARTEDGTGYRGIYLHHDGYLSHAGYLLAEHYATEEQVQALIDKGDLSSLDTTLEECDSYANRGERLKIQAGNNSEAVETRIGHSGHVYLWEGEQAGWRHNGHRINLPAKEEQP
jgi:hypothetical protein